ncbi:TATA element modulatory factor [Armadillidium nasatum]|uniref:TATA element modulatory factor n=1 Tax=Armadillidium nasatum TaxID=96803 RepID=A0A5N5SHD5_9CRUS|nr:TATA element modulatory factor [Armadillidium nasatum]
MSWFETTAFASIAKNAFKEAQKKIDEALDIRDEHTASVGDSPTSPLSSTVKKQLKESSENFFANFGISNEVDSSKTDESTITKGDQSTSNDEIGNARLVGSIWGSFTGSFFENPKLDSKRSSEKASSLPVTPSEVVATQPPRSLSNITEKSRVDSSESSSIAKLSVEADSSTSVNSTQSPFLEEIQEPFLITSEKDLNKNDSLVHQNDSTGWEWGWDSSIMVMSSASGKQGEDLYLSRSESFYQEENLADDSFDTEGFAKSRLIVGSIDSDASSIKRDSLGSVNSNKSQCEIDALAPVVEEVFVDDKSSSFLPENSQISNESKMENFYISRPTELYPAEKTVESPDSIVVLDSTITSPVEHPCHENDLQTKPFGCSLQLESMLSSPESIEVIGSADSLDSPSSIEVISGTSTEISSPTTHEASNTLSEDFTAPASTVSNNNSDFDSKTSNSTTENAKEKESSWKGSQEDADSQAITKQPISSVTKNMHKEDKERVEHYSPQDIVGCLVEESKESFHSSTTSSSTLTVVDVTDSQMQDHENLLLSMNAGNIRKNLEDVDKDVRLENRSFSESSKEIETSDIKKEEFSMVDSAQTSTTILEMSSRSESSTDTVTASIESQHLTWSELTPLDDQTADLESTTIVKEVPEVQDLIEDAMDDTQSCRSFGNKSEDGNQIATDVTDSNSNIPREQSPSSSDRSDPLKVSSGHSSGDELETATSSDIEVISSPSIDGSSNGNSRSTFNIPSSMANKVWFTTQRGLRTFINDKVDFMPTTSSSYNSGNKKDNNGNGGGYSGETVPSSMTTSFTSISESEGDSPHMPHSDFLQLEASRVTQALLQDIDARGKGHRRNKSNLSETSESSSEPQTPEVEKLLKKINHLTDVLETREMKVLELSHVNASLQETNLNMKSRLEELERQRKGNDNTECLREEYTQRMVVMERKFQQALREKEAIKKQLEEYKAEAASRRSHAEVAKEIEEKDIIIEELRREGEKLSKQQLTYSNTVKKDKIESLSIELDRLRKTLKAKEDVERRQIDAVRQLTIATQKQEEEMKSLKAENTELEGKLSALKEALDTAYKEMNELQRSAACKDAEAQKAALSAEVSAREKVETALSEAQKQSKKEQTTLLAQIHELQDTLDQTELQYNRKERQMKAETQDLLHRLSEAESRADEISSSISAATRPLLRQMENLQATHAAQQTTWESMEESLTKRLSDAQNAATTSVKKEREAKEHLASLMTEVSSLHSQIATLQSDNTQLKTKLEVATLKATTLEEAKTREANQLEALKNSFAEEISDIKHERDVLEQQLEIEKTAVSAEKRKSASLQEQLKEKDKKIAQLQLVTQSGGGGESRLSSPRSSPTPSLSRLSVAGSVNDSYAGSHWGFPSKQDDVFDSSWTGPGRNNSIYDALRGNSAATVDALTSALRQREAQRESLAQELIQSSRQSEEQVLKLNELQDLHKVHKDLEQKYNALLQMYGEKVEEVEELRLDLDDVKEMYKLQIDQLMKT